VLAKISAPSQKAALEPSVLKALLFAGTRFRVLSSQEMPLSWMHNLGALDRGWEVFRKVEGVL
jgi:hypothetical protein